jgi:hypothetical protein
VAGSNPLQQAGGKMAGASAGAGQGGVQGGYNALGSAGSLFERLGAGNPLFQQMVQESGALGSTPAETSEAMALFRSMPELASRQATGANVANDPAVKAAQEKFDAVMKPMIMDAAGLAGVGRSSAMTNALSSQQAQTLLPLIQESIAREERGIDRALGGTQSAAAGLFGGGQQANQQLMQRLGILGQAGSAGQQAQQAAAAGLLNTGQASGNLGAQEQAMTTSAMNNLFNAGNLFRGIEQEQLNAPYEEQMRLFSEALNSIYGPFGMIPGMTGATSTTGGKK